MKYLALIISFLFFLSCEKEIVTKPKEDTKVELVYLNCNDEVVIEWVGAKAGANKILFLNSLSTTNVLLNDTIRKEEIYNQNLVKYLKCTPTGTVGFSTSGIFHHNYFIEIVFSNDSVGYEKAGIGYTNGQPFTYYPVVTINLMHNTNPNYKITYVYERGQSTHNVLRGVPVNLAMINIYYNNDYDNNLPPIVRSRLQPVHKGTNVFTPSHKS